MNIRKVSCILINIPNTFEISIVSSIHVQKLISFYSMAPTSLLQLQDSVCFLIKGLSSTIKQLIRIMLLECWPI